MGMVSIALTSTGGPQVKLQAKQNVKGCATSCNASPNALDCFGGVCQGLIKSGDGTLETNLSESLGTKCNPKILKEPHFHLEHHQHIHCDEQRSIS